MAKKAAAGAGDYNEDSIKSLNWREHIRLRPGMYIGKLGDGASSDDGIYILLKEVIDNSIDEFVMGHGKRIEIDLDDTTLAVRDFGRGIPLGKLMECAAKINTGAKYDSEAFKRSVGLNGVGIKAVNALSSFFEIQAYRDKETRAIEFSRGVTKHDTKTPVKCDEVNGTRIVFTPDDKIFDTPILWNLEYVEEMLRNYAYLNPGLSLELNGKKFVSKRGLLDLLEDRLQVTPLYEPVHIQGEDVEVVFTHVDAPRDEYFTFVNGQNTTQGGSHLLAFREAVVKEVREFYKKQYDPADIRQGLVAVVSVKVQEPVFESQTKTKLGSTHMEPKGRPLRGHVVSTVCEGLDNWLYRHKETAEAIQARILRSEHERKEMSGIRKLAKDSARKTKLVNKKLRDCRAHYGTKHKRADESTLFVTEGDSASGSITKTRDVETQAVFSLRGKPLNCFGLSRKITYENEELSLLQNALGIDDGTLDGLRYNKVVIATDADVDGMHIRLLLLTFFLQFHENLVREGHVHILQTPLFRVRNKKDTHYCYSDAERQEAMAKLRGKPEITRFKGLGEISPDEFKHFIGPDIRLDPVLLEGTMSEFQDNDLPFFMGKNSPERQQYIIENLRLENDVLDDEEVEDLEEREAAIDAAQDELELGLA